MNPEIESKFAALAHVKNVLMLMRRVETEANMYGGEWIKEVRNHYGLSQIEMANHLGVTNFHLCKIEKGHESCTAQMLDKMYWVACLLERIRDAEGQESVDGVPVAEPGGRVESGVEG